jgi:glycosyltransferase involved in cell wall biosynthesis
VREVGARNLPLVLDLDDHLLLKGRHDGDYGPHQESLARLIEAASLVTVSTSELHVAMSAIGAPAALVPNAIDEALFLDGIDGPPRTRAQAAGEVRLVYAGSPTHGEDLMLLRPVLEELERRDPGRFVLDVVGVQPVEPQRSWFERTSIPDECKPYPQFVRWLRAQRPRWHIALAPLRDTTFNRYKSDLKWLEYTALGLPVVASAREPYRTITDGVDGRIVVDDPREWADALQALAHDPASSDRLVEAAWHRVTTSRLLRHSSEHLIDLLLSVRRS